MSDFNPTPGTDDNGQAYWDAATLTLRMKLIQQANPYMANRLDVVTMMAQQPVSLMDLVSNATTMYGYMAADYLANDLSQLSDQAQRGEFAKLSPMQQNSLINMGYQPPQTNSEQWYDSLVDTGASVLGTGMRPVAWAIGKVDEQIPIFSGLQKIWDTSIGRPYRTIQIMDEDSQKIAAVSGAATAAALLAAPFTRGASLEILGTRFFAKAAIAALGGAAAGAFVSDRQGFIDAWKSASDGERTFQPESVEAARAILQSDEMLAVAKQFALELPSTLSFEEIATEIAAAGSSDISSAEVRGAIENMLGKYLTVGAPGYDEALQGVYQLLLLPKMRQAITTLSQGKISIGRDTAELVGLEPGTAAYNIVSGTVDGATQMFMDPILGITDVAKAAQIARRGIRLTDETRIGEQVVNIARRNKSVMREHEWVARAVDAGDEALLRKYAPTWRPAFRDLVLHRNFLRSQGRLADGAFTVNELHDFITGYDRGRSIMSGTGTIAGIQHGVVLAGLSRPREIMKNITGALRSMTRGLSDARFEDELIEQLKKMADEGQLDDGVWQRMFPETVFPKLADDGTGIWQYDPVDFRNDYQDLLDEQQQMDAVFSQLTEEQQVIVEQISNDQNIDIYQAIARDAASRNDQGIIDLANRFFNARDNFRNKYRITNIDELSPKQLEAFALASEQFPRTRLFARSVGQIPGIKSVAGFVAAGFEKVLTMSPQGKVLEMWGPRSTEHMRALTEMGALTNMPSWMRKRHLALILAQPNIGLRRSLVRSFLNDMFTLAGMGDTVRGQQMIDEYVDAVFQSYGGSGIDDAARFGENAATSPLPSEMARAIIIPDIREVQKAARTSKMGEYLNLAEEYVAVPFYRKWKPAVLLRMGFALRAAGEEVVNLIARSGMYGLGQSMGATAVARYDRYQEVLKKYRAVGGDLSRLTLDEQAIYKTHGMPTGWRSMAQAMDRYNWTNPVYTVMERANQFYIDMLRNGVGGEWRQAIMRSVSGLEDWTPYNSTFARFERMSTEQLAGRSTIRERFSLATESMIYGSMHSWRRMLAGGADPETLDAMRLFLTTYQRSILAAVGATEAGVYSPDVKTADLVRIRVEDSARGKVRYETHVPVRGERELVYNRDPFFDTAAHAQMQRLPSDEVFGPIIRHIAQRSIPERLVGPELHTALRAFRQLVQRDPVALHLLAQFMGSPRVEDFRTVLRTIADIDGELAKLLHHGITEANFTPRGIIDIITGHQIDLASQGKLNQAQELEGLRNKLEVFESEVSTYLDGLSLEDRRAVGAFLRNADEWTLMLLDDIEPNGYQNLEGGRPARVLFRGITNPDQARIIVQPDGSLTLFLTAYPQPGNFGGGYRRSEAEASIVKAISTTPYHQIASQYVNDQGAPGSFIVVIDRDWAESVLGAQRPIPSHLRPHYPGDIIPEPGIYSFGYIEPAYGSEPKEASIYFGQERLESRTDMTPDELDDLYRPTALVELDPLPFTPSDAAARLVAPGQLALTRASTVSLANIGYDASRVTPPEQSFVKGTFVGFVRRDADGTLSVSGLPLPDRRSLVIAPNDDVGAPAVFARLVIRQNQSGSVEFPEALRVFMPNEASPGFEGFNELTVGGSVDLTHLFAASRDDLEFSSSERLTLAINAVEAASTRDEFDDALDAIAKSIGPVIYQTGLDGGDIADTEVPRALQAFVAGLLRGVKLPLPSVRNYTQSTTELLRLLFTFTYPMYVRPYIDVNRAFIDDASNAVLTVLDPNATELSNAEALLEQLALNLDNDKHVETITDVIGLYADTTNAIMSTWETHARSLLAEFGGPVATGLAHRWNANGNNNIVDVTQSIEEQGNVLRTLAAQLTERRARLLTQRGTYQPPTSMFPLARNFLNARELYYQAIDSLLEMVDGELQEINNAMRQLGHQAVVSNTADGLEIPEGKWRILQTASDDLASEASLLGWVDKEAYDARVASEIQGGELTDAAFADLSIDDLVRLMVGESISTSSPDIVAAVASHDARRLIATWQWIIDNGRRKFGSQGQLDPPLQISISDPELVDFPSFLPHFDDPSTHMGWSSALMGTRLADKRHMTMPASIRETLMVLLVEKIQQAGVNAIAHTGLPASVQDGTATTKELNDWFVANWQVIAPSLDPALQSRVETRYGQTFYGVSFGQSPMFKTVVPPWRVTAQMEALRTQQTGWGVMKLPLPFYGTPSSQEDDFKRLALQALSDPENVDQTRLMEGVTSGAVENFEQPDIPSAAGEDTLPMYPIHPLVIVAFERYARTRDLAQLRAALSSGSWQVKDVDVALGRAAELATTLSYNDPKTVEFNTRPATIVTPDRDLADALRLKEHPDETFEALSVIDVPRVQIANRLTPLQTTTYEPELYRTARGEVDDLGIFRDGTSFDADGKPVFMALRTDMWKPRIESAGQRADLMRKVDYAWRLYRSLYSKGTRRGMVPKMRRLDDGTTESMLFTRSVLDGSLVPVAEGESLSSQVTYLDRNGNAVEWNDEMFMSERIQEGSDELLWTVLGPILEDLADNAQGIDRTAPRPLVPEIGQPVVADEFIRLWRSRPEHIREAGVDVINAVDHVPLKTAKTGWVQRALQYPMDKVFGPFIDAVARRPQAMVAFMRRFKLNMAFRQWMVDPDIQRGVRALAGRQTDRHDWIDVQQSVGYIKTLARHVTPDGDDAMKWDVLHSLAWFRGHSNDEIFEMIRAARAKVLGKNPGALRGDRTQAGLELQQLWSLEERGMNVKFNDIRSMLPPDIENEDFLAYIRSQLPENALNSQADLNAVRDVISRHPVLRTYDEADWSLVLAAERNYKAVTTEAADLAAQAVMYDMAPFIDSHEYKTQFAALHSYLLPFWYAEENFLKRWGRTLELEGPAALRKLQLMYMGLKSVGLIRTDENGTDYFIYPGGNAVEETLKALGMGDALPVSTLFQTRADQMLPGMTPNVGTPAFGPLITAPLAFVANRVPALQQYRHAILGDVAGSSTSFWAQIVPPAARNIWNAIDSAETSRRYASAWTSTAAYLDAIGQGLPENASAGERDAYFEKLHDNTMVVVWSQALMGLFSMGPISGLPTEPGFAFNVTDVEDVAQHFGSLYSSLVRDLGIEQGTLEYIRQAPNASLTDIFQGDLLPDGTFALAPGTNPLAFTVPQSRSVSGAGLPATEIALKWLLDNQNYYEAYKYATPYLLPQFQDGKDQFSQYAYDQMTAKGMRDRTDLEDFVIELKFKQAANVYFYERNIYNTNLELARQANDTDAMRQVQQVWDVWSTNYLITHPIFAEQLTGDSARNRRAKVIQEMRVVLDDPGAPLSPQKDDLKLMLDTYDEFIVWRAEMALDRSASSREVIKQGELSFEKFMTDIVVRNPDVQTFWLGVLKPEASLE